VDRLIVFLFLAGLGAIAALATVGAYNALASDLPDPKTLESYALPEETVVYDRTGKVELARFGDVKREVVKFDEIPKVLIDATTAVEDKTFWDNAGFDPVAIAVGGHRARSEATVAARRRSPSSWSGQAPARDLVQDPHRTAERKLKEIIQSSPLTQPYEGEAGKQAIITAYLNQNYYGNQTYGVKAAAETYFGIAARQDRSRPGGDHRRPPEVALELRPRPQRHRGVQGPWPKARTAREGQQLVVRTHTTVVQRRDLILDLLSRAAARPMSGDQYTAADFRRPRDEPVTLARQAPRTGSPRISCGRSATSSPTSSATASRRATGSTRAACGSRRRSTPPPEDRREVGQGGRDRAPRPRTRRPRPGRSGFKKLEPWMANLRNKNLRNGALVASTTRPASSWRTSAARTTTRPRRSPSSSPSTTSPARATASPGRRSSRSTT
jgi:hypothetical protein